MAAPTISNTYNAVANSNGSDITVTVNGSSEFAVDDLLVVTVEIDGDQTTSGVTLTETGFTKVFEIASVVAGQPNTHVQFHKTLVSGDTSLTQIQANWTDSNEKACISVNRIAAAEHNGVDQTANSDEGDTSTPSSPSVTTTVDDCLVIIAEGHDGLATSTHPSGTTELSDQTPTGGGIVTMSTAHFTQATAGATGAKQWTLGNTRSALTSTIAIKPAGGTTYQKSVSEGAQAGETFGNNQALVTEGAQAGDTVTNIGTFPKSTSEGAKAGETLDNIGTFPKSISEGAKAGETITGGLMLSSDTSEGAKAGDTASSLLTRQGVAGEGAKAGDTATNIGTFPRTITEGAQAGESFDSIGTFPEAVSDGAKAGDTVAAGLLLASDITDGAKAGETFAEALLLSLSISEGARAGETLTALGTFPTAVAEGSLAGDTWSVTLTASSSISEGAKAGETITAPAATAEAVAINISFYNAASSSLAFQNSMSGTLDIKPQ